MSMIDPAPASNEPPPRRSPCSQLSSMKRTTEACEMRSWLTKFCLAKGEITRKGMRAPGPQRPFTGLPSMPFLLGLRGNAGAALAGTVELIGGRIIGSAGWGDVGVIIPAVGVVVSDDHGGVLPLRP